MSPGLRRACADHHVRVRGEREAAGNVTDVRRWVGGTIEYLSDLVFYVGHQFIRSLLYGRKKAPNSAFVRGPKCTGYPPNIAESHIRQARKLDCLTSCWGVFVAEVAQNLPGRSQLRY